MDPAVLAIGELNVDIVATGLSSHPRPGHEVIASELSVTLGSATAIFACQVRKLGHPVTFVGRVGNDDLGRFCTAELERLGIDTRSIVRSDTAGTGVTLSLAEAGDRALVTHLGAIAELTEGDLPPNPFEHHHHLHFSSFALQKGLRSSFSRLLQQAQKNGLTTSFDPNSDLREPTRETVLDLLPHVDLLFLNEREALELADERTPARALTTLGGRARGVVIKLGAEGAMAVLDGYYSEAPAPSVHAIDTTGAGDSFAGGFVSAFLRGATLLDSLNMGNLCGAASTERLGGTPGQPTFAQLSRQTVGGVARL